MREYTEVQELESRYFTRYDVWLVAAEGLGYATVGECLEREYVVSEVGIEVDGRRVRGVRYVVARLGEVGLEVSVAAVWKQLRRLGVELRGRGGANNVGMNSGTEDRRVDGRSLMAWCLEREGGDEGLARKRYWRAIGRVNRGDWGVERAAGVDKLEEWSRRRRRIVGGGVEE